MRHSDWLAGVVAVLAGGMGAGVGACVFNADFEDCAQWPHGNCPGVGTGGDGTGGNDLGPPPPACIPSENTTPVDNGCGVFVSSSLGDDGNTGTKERPLKTLGAGLDLAKGKPVYVCGESFSETVTISADARLYGGLNCAVDWNYKADTRTQLTAAADEIPLTITNSGTNSEVYDFAITSASATVDGGSSIGTLVAQAMVSFTRCNIMAGAGKAGVTGVPFQMSAASGSGGDAGTDACLADQSFGGNTVTNECGSDSSISGLGGIGDVFGGGNGGPGQPEKIQNGGSGETGGGCSSGGKGGDGAAGGAGPGATGLGTLSANGYTGVTGIEGHPGGPGQGGGGGGGAKGGTGTGKCSAVPANMTGGASGGSGGSGGCGGAGGKGGSAGGSSIALASINATLLLTSVSFQAGAGGLGGNGGSGQSGGNGGDPGAGGKAAGFTSLNDACPGGKGGAGGLGGKGGGGRGGHSIGIAFTGNAPPASSEATWKVLAPGTFGNGGAGDNANGNMGDGAAGIVADMQQFP